MDQIDSLMDNEEFPLPISITKTDFKSFDSENIDEFLYKNHRFTSIDTLTKELTEYSTELNQILLDLVNDDYNDFISLGKSINNSSDYINYIMNDLNKFKLELAEYYDQFKDTIENIDSIINLRLLLVKIKTLAKVNLLLNDLINNFETTLESNESTLNLNQLTGFYLGITNLFNYLEQSDFDSSPFVDNYLSHKIASLNLEFKSHLADSLKKAKLENDKQRLLELLNIYKIIGEERVFIEKIM